jgi:hypothetical protein
METVAHLYASHLPRGRGQTRAPSAKRSASSTSLVRVCAASLRRRE